MVLEAGSGRDREDRIGDAAPGEVLPRRAHEGDARSAGETFQVEGMVVDWAGKLNPTALKQVQIELVHLEADYSYGYDDDSGESRYDRWLREVPEAKTVAKVESGKFTFDVTPGDALGRLPRAREGRQRAHRSRARRRVLVRLLRLWRRQSLRHDAAAREGRRSSSSISPKEIKVGEA